MKKIIFKNFLRKIGIALCITLFLVMFIGYSGKKIASASAGDVVVVVSDELNQVLSGASVTINCTDGNSSGTPLTAIDGGANDDDGLVNGQILFLSSHIGNSQAFLPNCGIGTNMILTPSQDGYVTPADFTTAYDPSIENDQTLSLLFSYKLTSVTDELGNLLSGVTVTAGDSYTTSCSENRGTWYCPVPLADSNTNIKGAEDGYVTKDNSDGPVFADRQLATDPQNVETITNLKFSYKITNIFSEAIVRNFSLSSAAFRWRRRGKYHPNRLCFGNI